MINYSKMQQCKTRNILVLPTTYWLEFTHSLQICSGSASNMPYRSEISNLSRYVHFIVKELVREHTQLRKHPKCSLLTIMSTSLILIKSKVICPRPKSKARKVKSAQHEFKASYVSMGWVHCISGLEKYTFPINERMVE